MHNEEATLSDSTASGTTTGHPSTDVSIVETTANAAVSPSGRLSRRQKIVALVIPLLLAAAYVVWPYLEVAFNSISTDDAYVNGHVTFVAPRISGQVSKVLVDDNYRVSKGDLLIQLDPEPYRIIVETKQAAVAAAEADLVAANAQVRALIGQARANRYNLEFSIEQVDNQIAQLRADVATLNSRKAELDLSRSNLKRAEKLEPSGAISVEELDVRRQALKVDEANVEKALQAVYAQRVSLGLSPQAAEGQELTDVPADLNQNFSTVRQSLEQLVQSAAEIGYYPSSWEQTPQETLDEFYQQDPKGNLDHIYAHIIPQAPMIKQAESKLLQARRDLEQAELNLRYCDVVSEIDGVVSRRNVNPGNNVLAGESLMVVRSLTEIWIDANFKETQLGYLRIGQPVRCEVDMYGGEHEFEGRITGFSMGSGQTLALLPPQNATGNFVKIVQRLPVRIELVDYDPDKLPLFAGLSVEPHVYYKEPPAGPNAGKFLHAHSPLPQRAPEPTPTGSPVESSPAADKPNP